jgi:ribonuclease/clavin/mitogillin
MNMSGKIRKIEFICRTIHPSHHTNAYLVGENEFALVDPGSADDDMIGKMLDAAAEAGGDERSIKILLLTHFHRDHLEGVPKLKRITGALVVAHRPIFPLPLDIDMTIDDGDVIKIGGMELTAVHTPGHAKEHFCFHVPSEKALLTGDMILGEGTVIIAPPWGDMKDYMDSLEKLKDFEADTIYPGHGPDVHDPRGKIEEYIRHRLMRESQVIESLEKGIVKIPEMVKVMYANVPEFLHPLAESSVLANLIKLRDEGRVGESRGGTWRLKRG